MWNNILSICVFFSIAQSSESKTCDTWSFDIQNFYPLPLFENEDGLVHLNERYGMLEIEDGQSMTMSCIGSYLEYYGVGYKNLNSATVTCRNETLFSDDWIPGEELSMKWISCFRPPNIIQKQTENKCGDQNKGKLIEIYVESQLHNNHLIYESCFDDSIKQPLYVKHKLEKTKLQYFTNTEKKYFKGDSETFAGIQLNKLYDNRYQMSVLQLILGDVYWNYFKFGDRLINGSLILPHNFQYDPMQRATYEYVNSVPIWDKIQSGSWTSSSSGVKLLAENASITVYTGAWGIQTLKDVNGEDQEIRSLESTESKRYPSPRWIYKVAYDESSKKGIAFLILNNPFLTMEEGKELAKIFPCSDACPNWNWIMNVTPEKGYVVCCDVNDFRKVIKDLPEFETVGLLP